MADDFDFPDLVARIHEGDQDACHELVQRYSKTLRRMIRCRLRQSPLRRLYDSEDFVQWVWLRFFSRTEHEPIPIPNAAELIGFLQTLARTAVAECNRKHLTKRRDLRRTADVPVEQLACEGQTDDAAGRLAPFSGEVVTRLRQVLTQEQFELVRLRSAGRAWDELASHFGATPPAIRSRHRRICEKLRPHLRPWWSGGGADDELIVAPIALLRSHFVLSGRILLLPRETGLPPDISKWLRYTPPVR